MLVSSHLMSELQDTADHLVVVGRGKVIADTTVADLIAAASGDQVILRTSAPAEAAAVLARAGATVAVTGSDELTVTGLAAEKVIAALGRGSGAVLRGVGASRDAWKRPTWSSPATRSSSAPPRPGDPGTRPPAPTPGRRPDERRDHRRVPLESPAGRDGFGQLLRAEWTKFRTVRGWVIGMIIAALVTAGIGSVSTTASAAAPDGRGLSGGCAVPGRAARP